MGDGAAMALCRRCGTLNRIAPGRASPRCGHCHTPLPAAAPGGGGGGPASTPPRPAPASPPAHLAHPLSVSDPTFEAEVLRSSLPVLLDCWAPWCGPCQALGPALERLAATQAGRLKVCKLNVDENPRVAQQLQVMALPTLLAFRQGLMVGRQMGMQPADRLTAWLRQLGMI